MRTIATLIAAAAIAACGSNPAAPSSDSFMTATVDGEPFRASFVYALISRTDGYEWLNVVALDGCTNPTSVQLLAYRLDSSAIAVGEYSTSRSTQISLGPGVSTVRRELVASFTRSDQYWEAGTTGGGSGSLTVTSLSSAQIEGTFSFSAAPRPGNTVGGTKSVTGGAFRATLQDKRIC